MNNFDTIFGLNQQYALPGQLTVVSGPGKLPLIVVNNPYASAVISIYGAQPLEYRPTGQQPVLWLSDLAAFLPGKAIRGGIPLCWPWFGKHPTEPKKPAHGFARISQWQLTKTSAASDGSTLVECSLSDSAETQALWPYHFELRMMASIGPVFQLTLTAINRDTRSFQYTAAEHSYFNISDSEAIQVEGLDGTTYVDTTQDELPTATQHGPIRLHGFHNRIYQARDTTARIIDPGYQRTLQITARNSGNVVTWNPHIEGSAPLSDLGPEDYRRFFCLETANTAGSEVTLQAGESHSMTQVLEVLS